MTLPAEVLADSPHNYWRLEETSGTDATDETGNNDGTHVNTPTLGVNGVAGSAVFYTAGSSERTTLGTPTYDGVAAVTLEAWVKLSALGAQQFVWGTENTFATESLHLRVNALNAARFELRTSVTGSVGVSGATVLTTGGWYHLVGVYNGTDIRVYVNGVLDASPVAATGTVDCSTAFAIAARPLATPDRFFTGTVDEVAGYKTALTAARVLAHYRAGILEIDAVTGADLLDLSPSIRSRAESARFDVVDQNLDVLFALHPDTTSPPTVEHSADGTVKRQLTGLRLTPDEAALVDVFAHRVRPWWVLSTGDEYPLGVFLFQDTEGLVTSYGDWVTAGSLFDQSIILEQGRPAAYGLNTGSNVSAAMQAIADEVDLPATSVTPSAVVTEGYMAWPPGTTRLQILHDLAGVAGYFDPYFDHNGTLVLRPAVDPSTATATHVYGTGADVSRVVKLSARKSNDAYKIPSKVIVTSTNALGTPVSGSHEVPASAPHSAANRGYEVVLYVTENGIPDTTTANARAEVVAQQNAPYEKVSFDSPVDPRHDALDVVEFDGVNYLERRWSLTMTAGGPMRHELSRLFGDS